MALLCSLWTHNPVTWLSVVPFYPSTVFHWKINITPIAKYINPYSSNNGLFYTASFLIKHGMHEENFFGSNAEEMNTNWVILSNKAENNIIIKTSNDKKVTRKQLVTKTIRVMNLIHIHPSISTQRRRLPYYHHGIQY